MRIPAWLRIGDRFRIGDQPRDRVLGDEGGDRLRRVRAFGTKPVCGPIQRAEEGARADRGIRGAQQAAAAAVGDQRANAALVAVALGDDARAQARRQGIDGQMRRRPLDLVEQAQHVGRGHAAEAVGQGAAVARRRRQRLEQPVERSVLAEKENLFLAAEVVIEVSRRQVRRDGDLAHPRGGEAAGAEDARRRPHDLDAARLGAN
jgi:hypothetical protein